MSNFNSPVRDVDSFENLTLAPRRRERQNKFLSSRNVFRNSIEFRSRLPLTTDTETEIQEVRQRRQERLMNMSINELERTGNLDDFQSGNATLTEVDEESSGDEGFEEQQRVAVEQPLEDSEDDSPEESSEEEPPVLSQKDRELQMRRIKVLEEIRKAQAAGRIKKLAAHQPQRSQFKSKADEQQRVRNIVAMRQIIKAKSEETLKFMVQRQRSDSNHEVDSEENILMEQEIESCLKSISEGFWDMRNKGKPTDLIFNFIKESLGIYLDRIHLIKTRFHGGELGID
jgi:hypothetical protein